MKLTVLLAPEKISKRDNNGFTPGAGHSTISKTPSLSSSRSKTSGTPSVSESKQVFINLLVAKL